MIKFFTDILRTIPNKDKLKALSFLLLAFIIIRVTPSILGSLNNSCKNLELKSRRDDKEIVALDSTITKEKTRYLKAQKEFTEHTAQRETEFLLMLDSLADKLAKMRLYEKINEKVYNKNLRAETMVSYSQEDTLVLSKKETKVIHINKSSIMIDDIFNDIKCMKKSINKK
jgi:hypothetical protein